MAKVRVVTPAFVAGNPELLASFQGMDDSRLQGRTIRLGLLDNTKPNTGLLLEKIGDELSAAGLVANIVSVAKASAKGFNPASAGAPPELLERLAKEADFVITGLGN
jgi:hypothetical protein